MNFRKHSLCLACVFLGLVVPAPAETLKLPKAKPAFILDVPEGWTVKPQDAGGIVAATKKDDYAVVVTEITGIHTKDQAKKGVKVFIEKMAEAMKIKSLELGDLEDQSDDNGSFFAVRGDGKDADGAEVINCHIFEQTKGRWFIIMGFGAEAANDTHEKEYVGIVNSIQGIK